MIREATHEDLIPIVSMAVAMSKESARDYIQVNEFKVLSLLAHALGDDSHMLLVYEKGGESCGFLLANITPYFFGDELVAQEKTLYIKPECRGGSAAFKLIKSYVNWAKKKEVKEIIIGVHTGINQDLVEKLYKKAGFEQMGTLFNMRGDC